MLYSQVLYGFSVKWQGKHKGICIFLALWGQIFYSGGAGYCIVILLDTVLMISNVIL